VATNVNRQELDNLGMTEQERDDIAVFFLAMKSNYGPSAGDEARRRH
jgi:hypothetical protein